jgi:preprotein translocase subunit SecE
VVAKQGKQAAEEAEPKQPRQIRKVETVREKAEKSVSDADKPRRLHKTRRVAGSPFRLLGLGFRELGKFKPFHILGLVIVPPYFRNSWKELRQVTWPSRRDSRRLTLAVIMFATIFGVLVALIDFGLDKAFKEVLLK